MAALWRDGDLCDVCLVAADGHCVRAHRIVLASASTYFQALLLGAGAQCAPPKLSDDGLPKYTFEHIDHASLLAVLRVVYEGSGVELTADNVCALLHAANYLDIDVVREACCQFLLREMSPSTALPTLALAARLACASLHRDAMAYVQGRFEELVASAAGAGLAQLPAGVLTELLQSEALAMSSELTALRAVMAWLEGDARDHGMLASAEPLAARAVREALEASAGAEVLGAAEGAGDDAPVGRAAARLPPPRQSMPRGLLAAGGHDVGWHSQKATEVYEPHRDAWALGEVLPSSLPFAGGAPRGGGGAALVGGAPHCGTVLLCGSGGAGIRPGPSMARPRVHSAVASVAGDVYVLGGRAGIGTAAMELHSVEVLPAGAEDWRWAPELALPRTALGAAALDGCLYAIGGQAGKAIHTSVECFDTVAERWDMQSADLLCGRKYCSVAALNGRLYVVGGMNAERQRLTSCEAWDPRDPRGWAQMPALAAPRSSAGVAALHGRLFAVGGSASDDVVHGSCEVYEPAANRWRPAAALNHCRSGFVLVPV
ncbi:hypothetical protein WJX81_007541 [Elliptochloris bilobata]|uniref:BTB domain-containing protein n=1 Tax=Elliptochloris bilobata TaxID=381761 RepID=A0AAW1S9Z0_9CHLO